MQGLPLFQLKNRYETDRIALRPLTSADVDDAFLSWFQDEALMRFYTNTRQQHSRATLLDNIRQGVESGTSYVLAIVERGADTCIGTIKVGPMNRDHLISDLVVLIGDRRFHGKGLAVEAIQLGNEVSFRDFGIRKLYGGMYETNQSSLRAYLRAGWVEEGRLKGQYLVDGQAVDRILVACFNPDFFPESAK